jgi:hypothetical protein
MTTETMTTTTTTIWRRRGSEAEAEDRAARHTVTIGDEDLACALAEYYESDLDDCADDAEREEAISALVDGYRGRA